ncbi:MAG: hypothetical protein ACI8XO_001597 [Verrucomicrobiales bacterium]|jgi:hypothetical protein
MNKQSNRSNRAWQRALLTVSAGTLVALSLSSCGSTGGMLSRGKDKDDSARVAEDAPEKIEKPKRANFFNRGSIFSRAKDRNSYIDDSIQTTRRDRFAAQNTATLAPAPEPDAAATMTGRQNDDFATTPRTPNYDFQLDPNPTIDSRPTTIDARPKTPTRMSTPREESLRLPSLDSDFPQNSPSASADPNPGSSPRPSTNSPGSGNDGYTPLQLQPRLPGNEPIQPPSE